MNLKLPHLVAEISANHCGKLSIAKKLIKCAKINGADSVKIQTFTADTMTIKSKKKFFKVKNGLWKNYTLWDLYNKAHTPLSWHKELFEYAKKIGITLFSTPFDEMAVNFLEDLKCPIYKVASFEMTDIPLIEKIASTKKPMIISTGMASLDEIERTYTFARKAGAKDITLLYCVSNYPAKSGDFNLNNIKILKKKFGCRVGLSDHSIDNSIAIASIGAGAEIIEKHIALDNQQNGLDIKFALKGKKIKKFKENITKAYEAMGKEFFFRKKSELKNRIFRRSIFVVDNIEKGEKFTEKNIRRIRPGHGLDPLFYKKILGKKSKKRLNKGMPLKKGDIKLF
jgi:pseudaminic acid synthase